MKLQKIKLSELLEPEWNYNKHPDSQIDELAKSLDLFDQFKNIVVWHGFVIAGNGLVMAARKKGWQEISVLVRDDLAEEQAKALCVADNALPIMAEPDEDTLRTLLEAVDDPFDIPGVDEAWLESMDINLDFDVDEDSDTDDTADDIPEGAEPVCKSGDLWQLGGHRILCGDCTDKANVDKLMDSEEPDRIIFDPPYDIEHLYDAIPNPEPGQKLLVFWDFKRFAIAPAKAIEAGWNPLYEFIWDCCQSWYTPNRPLARHKACGLFGDDPKFNFDDAIIYDGKKREAKTVSNTRGTSDYKPLDGAVHIRTVEQFPNTQQNDEHGQGKPMAWISAIFNWIGGDIYLDMFGGSGATLIACEKTGRKCRMMEIDEKYCDIIIKRWEDYTGKKGVKL